MKMTIIKMTIIKIMNIFLCTLIALTSVTAAYSKSDASNMVRIGTIVGPETELVEVAKDIAKKKYNLDVEIIQFTDYLQPNAALEDGSIDINMFQHVPFLEQQINSRGYHLIAVAKTFIFPMAIYSKKHKDFNDIAKGAIIAIPNDPTNEGRALLLLQQAGLIKLKKGVDYSATPKDIEINTHDLRFMELEGPQLPRTLLDVDYAVINNTFAYSAGLNPQRECVYTESTDSPYANVLAVKVGHEHEDKILKLIKSLQSSEVSEKAKVLFKNTAVVAW